MRNLLLALGFIFCYSVTWAQPDTITTAPPLVANNGQSGVTFEFESTQPVNIVDLECIFNGATTANLWMRIGGVLHTGATSPNISTTNGWSQVITNAPVSGGSTTTKGLMDFGGTKIAIPANTRIGFFVEAALRYQTGTAADQTTFTDGTASVFVTDAIAFGGALPSPTFNPRRFLGSVIYELGVSGNCTPFTNFAFTNITGTSADVSWTPGTGNTSFYMEYGVAGFTPGTGTTVTGTHPGAQPPVLLTGLLPQTTYDVYFGEICNAGADSVSFPTPQSFTTTKLCAPPNTLAISNVLATTADVSWMYPGTANDFDIIYGPVGFDPTTAGTSVTVTSSPHTLTGLNPATAYDAYVVANCGMTNGYSDTIGPEFFFTNCAITAAPFTEKFDNATWVASGNNNGNQLNPCWTSSPDVSSTLAFKWIPRATAPTSGNGPLSDFTGGNFLYCEASGATAGQIAELVSPLIDVSGLTTPALYFMQHRFYTTASPPAPMDVEVSNDGGTTWSNVYSISGNTQNSSGDPWELVFVNLGAYIGDTIQLKFIQTSVGCCGDAAIDSVVVDEAPLCPWPTNVAITGITSTTADFSWADPTGTSWDIEWGPCGYSQGTGTFANTSTNPYTATGLAPNTCYDMYVRANCNAAGNGTSIWIGPIEFRTACAPFTAPYSDNFDANVANVVPICWNAIREVQTGTAAAIETYTFAVPNSAPNHIRMYNGSGQWANGDATILISPEFSDLTAGDKRVQFFAYKTTTATVTLIVGTMDKADTSGTFSPIDTVTLNSTSNHELFIVDVDNAAGYNGTDTYIALAHGMSSTFQTIYIDDFSYGFVPLCNPPLITTLGVSGTGTTTGSVFWGSGSDGDETHIEWGTPGFTPGTGSYLGKDSVPGTQDMYTIQGLSAQTTYEYYIQDSCVGNGFSPWVGPISFTTQCNVLTAPLVENFDGTSWVASGNNAGNMLDPCWASTPDVSQGATAFKWIPRSTAPTSGNGPLSDLTGGNFMYCEASGATAGQIAYLYSPLIDLSGLAAPALYFWQHRFYTTTTPPAPMDVEVTNDNGVTWTNVYTISGNLQNANSDPWEDEFVNLPQFAGDTIQVRFVQTSVGCCGDAAIDSVAIAEAPACPDPAAVNIASLLDTSMTLTWAGALNAIGHEVWFGPQGFYQGTQTTTGTKQVVSTNSFTWSPLTPQTCYEILVRSICPSGDTSMWVGPIQFCTPCSAFNAPYFENFDGMPTGVTPGCYTAVLQGGATQLSTIQVTNVGGAYSAPNHVWMDNYTNTLTMMISPLFGDMTAGDKWVTFYAKQAASGLDELVVGTVSSPGNPASFSPLDTFTMATNFQRFACNLTALNGYNGTDQYFAIQHASTLILRDIYIDDILYSIIPSGDLATIGGDFIKGECLSNNDSIYVQVVNTVSPVNFATDPLTVSYDVTGPANTAGNVVINSGTLAVNDTLTVWVGGIDLSQVGTYNLKAWTDTSSINQITSNDTINGITIDVKPEFQVNPKVVTLASAGDSVEICVESSFFGGGEFLITEQCHFKTTNGSPVGGWPAYIGADDYIEITGVPGADLAGMTLEQWNTTAIAGTYTFPAGTILSPNGTAIIAVGQMGTSTPSPANFYYHGNGNYTGSWGSGSACGRILKAADGSILDAVIVNAFTWPASSGVTAADWSGTVPSTSGTGGNRLEGPDLNSSTGWISSATSPQDPNVVNNNVPAPKSAGAPGLTWSYQGNVIDTLPCITVGPYSGTGTYQYIASFTNACGTFTDTVTVILPNCSAPSNLVGSSTGTNSIALSWDTVGTGAATFDVEYGKAGFTLGSGTRMAVMGNSMSISGLANNLCHEAYVRSYCSASDTSAWVGPVTVCTDRIPCDNFDQYDLGSITGQSALIVGWYGSGVANFSNTQSTSGSQSLYISANGTDDAVAWYDTLSTGAWNVAFDIFVPTGTDAYYNIQRNYTHGLPANGTNVWAFDVFLLSTGTANVDGGSYGGTGVASFSFNPGQWNRIEHIIDLTNDTVWIQVNGSPTTAGWQYSFGNLTVPIQHNGVNFFSNPALNSPDYYVDDFCVTPYSPGQCPAPSNLGTSNLNCTSTDLTWISNSGAAQSWIEYGPAGFTPLTGAGTIVWGASPLNITGLTPGASYDFYAADTCALDTSQVAGPFTFMAPTGPISASFTHTLGTAGPTNLNAFFDASASQGATTYSWDFGDGNTGSGQNTSHLYTANGDYYACLTVTGPCGTDSICDTIKVRGIDLIDYNLANSLLIYPNPSHGIFKISFDTDNADDVEISIMDLSGKVIVQRSVSNFTGKFEDSIDLSEFADGSYLLRIESRDGAIVRRLIKE